MPELDLSKLEGEIKQRKSLMMKESSSLGEIKIAPKDGNFIHEIQTALHTRSHNGATNRMNAINKVSEAKLKAKNNGGTTTDIRAEQILNAPPAAPPTRMSHVTTPQQINEEFHDRDQKLYEEMERLQNRYTQSYGLNTQYSPQPPQGNMPLNEQFLNEIITKQLPQLVVETMKNVVMEMYKSEKFIQSLLENRDIVEKIIREHLRELQDRNKKKTA